MIIRIEITHYIDGYVDIWPEEVVYLDKHMIEKAYPRPKTHRAILRKPLESTEEEYKQEVKNMILNYYRNFGGEYGQKQVDFIVTDVKVGGLDSNYGFTVINEHKKIKEMANDRT